MGDFNYDPSWESEKAHIDSAEYENVWETLRPDDPEAFTMNFTPKYNRWFPDRILIKTGSDYEATFVDRVGVAACASFTKNGETADKIKEDGVVRTPSDHMGLVAVFSLKE